MRIALVNPPVENRYIHNIDEPLNLEYLAAQVCNKHDVLIIDSFSNRLTVDETIKLLNNMKVDVVGISLVFTGAYKTTLAICEGIKGINTEVVTVLGGNTATFMSENLVSFPYVDIISRGEGDLSFPILIDALEKNSLLEEVPGITFVKDGNIVSTKQLPLVENLDILPFPARELLPFNDSYPKAILSSRGCAYGCIYCSTAAFWSNSFRKRSIENIMSEINLIIEKYGATYFSFADDCFTLIPKRAIEISKRIKGLNKELTWGCTGRIETMSEELIRCFSESGCKSIFFGIESGSTKVLKSLKRNYTPEQVYEVYRVCIKYNIRPYFSFIVGLPDETLEDVKLTFRLISRLEGVENGVHMLTPFPSTPIAVNPDEFGLTLKEHGIENLDINSRSYVRTRNFETDEIEELFQKAVGYSFKALRKSKSINQILSEKE